MGIVFNVRKPRQFNYKPRFYDPKKDELEQLKAKYGPIGDKYKRKIDFRAAMNKKKEEKLSKPFPVTKILLFACVVVMLVYVLIYFVEKWQ
ncbi:MAG: hypothetical protein J6M30_06295 [Bacteroidales bacterium]|nr:hypothetical protein [Bacteroidales bacterium]